jgi:PleD family two-component response regulator
MPLRILLIEDYQVDRWLVCHALRQVRLAVDVHEATDGATGLRMLQQEAFDCVLLDYWLSDMDGLEFLAQLQTDEASPRVPIVMLTGESSPSIAVEAMKYGVQDYLVKEDLQPATLEQALTRAMAIVAESREQQQAYIDLERQVQEHTTALSHTSKQLELSRSQLRELANRMLSVQEEDRKRLARELHDELG